MYLQRQASPRLDADAAGAPWLVSDADLCDDAAAGQPRYVVVDDLDDDLAILVVAPWPRRDPHGRLVFGDPDQRDTVAMPADLFHRAVAAARATAQAPAPDRPLRIGDAFFAVVTTDAAPERRFTQIRDVTRQAREQAKLAHFSAVTPRLSPDEVEALALAGPDDEEPPTPLGGAGPTASPAI